MSDTKKKDKSFILTIIGLVAMALMISTKLVPSSKIAGYSIFVGIAFFFIVEAVGKTPSDESGLRFKTFFKDIKKPWVLPLVLLPVVSGLTTMFIGDRIFSGGFSTYLMGRTDSLLSFDKIPALIIQVVVAALGEEIAWRGFFVGKAMKIFPFWACALVSSALFAAGHIAVGNFGLVLFDVSTIFIDSVIYAVIYRKTGNCLLSTVSHILCNAAGIAVTLIFI